ncbi:MAG: uracil-DNA glycosylase family protein [Paludibacteraceae bacterium]|nr:uracil-DNA glycosylase family protein [Paludibacteraceae bacterium]
MTQYAINQKMKLIAMAEFRFEENGTIHYVPSCKDKCGPLLKFMLKGIGMKRKKMMNGNSDMSGRIERHPLGMFLPKDSMIMMLGSFPPKRNRWCMDFYYPNWLNDMWRIQGIVWYNDAHFFEVERENRFDKEKIIRFLKEKKIALGDTATKVIRENDDSSDLHLKVVEKIDLGDVLEKATDLQLIISTGGKSAEMFCEIVGIEIVPKIGKPVNFKYGNRELTFCRMVSSSRAYPMKLEEKAKQYEFMRNFEDKLSREHNG